MVIIFDEEGLKQERNLSPIMRIVSKRNRRITRSENENEMVIEERGGVMRGGGRYD